MTSVWKNLRWGIQLGLAFAVLFSVWIVVLIVLNGSLTLHLRNDYSVNAFAVFASYLWGGVTAGVIVGLLRPLGRNRWGAALIGFIAAVPVFVGARVGLKGFAPWEADDTLTVLIASVVMGIIGGVRLWDIWHRDARRRRRTKHGPAGQTTERRPLPAKKQE